MIVFAWWGFPQYAARCVRAFVESTDEEVVVVATPPAVPVRGMDEICGCRVIWVSVDDPRPLKELLDGKLPRALTISGWSLESHLRYAREVRANGGKVLCGCDNNFTGFSWRECLKALRFRVFLRHRFDGFWVPGRSGARLMSFYGVPPRRVFTQMYAADDALFTNGLPLAQRPKRLLYVGQFIERKNVVRLCQAFEQANPGDWSLDLYGSGELKPALQEMESANLHVHDFVQPEQLAGLYRSARIFCLPSLEEHWGLVVHEAVLSGCLLLLSDKVGAADDLLDGNGACFDPLNVDEMAAAFRQMMSLSDEQANSLQAKGLVLARNNSVRGFVNAVKTFVGT